MAKCPAKAINPSQWLLRGVDIKPVAKYRRHLIARNGIVACTRPALKLAASQRLYHENMASLIISFYGDPKLNIINISAAIKGYNRECMRPS